MSEGYVDSELLCSASIHSANPIGAISIFITANGGTDIFSPLPPIDSGTNDFDLLHIHAL